MSKMIPFEQWYISNRSYYAVKHGGVEKDMRDDALSAHAEMRRFSVAPKAEQKSGVIKKKPNPYGFHKDTV